MRGAFIKSLLYSAKIYDYTKHGSQYGVSVQGSSIDQKAVIDRKDKVVKALVSGIGMSMKRHGVTVKRQGEGDTWARQRRL